MKKKLTSIFNIILKLLVLVLVLTSFVGCEKKPDDPKKGDDKTAEVDKNGVATGEEIFD